MLKLTYIDRLVLDALRTRGNHSEVHEYVRARLRWGWTLTYGRIYLTLDSLERRGLVTHTIADMPYPRKYFYSLTEAGEERIQ